MFSAEGCTYTSNLINVDTEVTMDDIKDPLRPTFIRLTSPGCPYTLASQAQWEKAASLYPQVNFVTVDSWKNTKITSLFGQTLSTPYHGLFLANSSSLIEDSEIGNPPEIHNSPQRFLTEIKKHTNLYPIAPPLVSLSPVITDSFYSAVDDPIFLLYDSRCSDQVPFLNAWSTVANEVIFSNGVNPRIGILDCSIYSDECQRWSHPYAVTTPRALIYSSKTGNYEVLDTIDNINSEKIDGLYANALSRAPKATPSPVPIPVPDTSLPSSDGYTIIENTQLREQKTIASVIAEYIAANVAPASACKVASECEPKTLNSPSQCPNIEPSEDDHTNALKMFNFFRGLAGLPKDLTEETEWSKECYKTAINMHKIGKVPSDHIIKNEYANSNYCGEANNVQVSKDSLLSENAQSVFQSSIGLIKDEGTHNNGVVGHRRYLLQPNLKHIGIGFYPLKYDQFDGYYMMRPAVTVIRIRKENQPAYSEEIPDGLNFTSWPPEGPFPLDQLPSNWHITHPDFKTAKLSDLRIFVRRDDGAELKVRQSYLINSGSSQSLVMHMTDEALKRCLLMRTITVTIFNDALKKIYRFSFELIGKNEVTEVCLYVSNSDKCPQGVRALGPGNYQDALFTTSTNPIKIHVVDPITIAKDQKISLTAATKFFIVGDAIDGKIEIGYTTNVDVQNPSKTTYDIVWDVKAKKIGLLETTSTAKAINVVIQNDDETISIYDITFYTGRQTTLGLSKAIYTGTDYDLYYSIGGVNNGFFVMASPSEAFAEFKRSDNSLLGPNIKEIGSIYNMINQKTNKRVIKFYVSMDDNLQRINMSCFIPGRKRDYQIFATGKGIYFECDMNISSVANSITIAKYSENKNPYDFDVFMPTYKANDERYICPMDFVTINGATMTGDSATKVLMPYLKGDQAAINFNNIANFNDLYPLEGAEDNGVINAIPGSTYGAKTRCIITTPGNHDSYLVYYDSENPKKKYRPFIFHAAPGSEEKPITLTFEEIYFKKPLPEGPTDFLFYFENYQDLTLNMPSVRKYRSNVVSLLGAYNFDNCGKVTFAGNDDTTPASFEIDHNLVLGNFNYGCIIIAPVLVTGSKTYDGTWVQATNLTVSPNLKPTITNITVNEKIIVDSSSVILDKCTINKDIDVEIKKTASWWPSISFQETSLQPKAITIDLGIKPTSAKLLDSSDEYESHSILVGVECDKIQTKATIINNGKFNLECSSDKTELVVIKGKENAPVLKPDEQPPTTGGEKPPSPTDDETQPTGDASQPAGGETQPTSDEIEEPVVTPMPVPTKPPELIKPLEGVSNDMPSEELDEKIKDLLTDMEDENKEGNNVVSIDVDKVNFNTTLNDTQFILPKKDSTVHFDGGNLNLVIPEKVTVVLSDAQNSNLLIKGQGSVSLDFKESEKQPDEINLKSKSQINGTVEITVPKNVKSLVMESIDLDSSSQISVRKDQSDGEDQNPVKFTIKEVSTQPETKAKLSDVTIEKTLNIAQRAVLDLNNVDFNSASVSYSIDQFDTLKKPFIKGKFKSLPYSLKFNKISGEGNKPSENVEYPIVSGTFEDIKCEDWYPKVDLGTTGFNTKVCKDIAKSIKILASEDKSLVLKYDPNNKGDDSGDKNKLSAGAIAGIVIAVVVVIAIVVVVVIIVMKRKKNLDNSSDNENAGNTGKDEV